ncbi:MAG: 16S rRNA (guanine(527)-N(7))-methyltransferase RsmG [Lachnospiraceae bacterium]|nr:16S rRNA (guanine(527)-N(7))-methyltransferase RsmG [Lachnospiraceae bacterium]MCI9400058.1 16S rRNA (guanine(527)-N(7))-methyltransferase RsmG [Lachnospiraceae bacterium]MCX4376872.1 16S rRNA (guanine(527)-N(7))-methyltransferase RsmG [Lachnospiraceae bacterium]
MELNKKSTLPILEEGLQDFGIVLEEKQKEQFLKFYQLLTEWNAFMNLTAITEFDEVCIKHFLDSAALCKVIALSAAKEQTLIDVGTGAGFPAIPLKIIFPNLKVTMLDALNKRVKFLNEVIAVLELHNIEAIHGRAEDYAKPDLLRERFDICVSRAVAHLSTLSEYCLPYVKRKGFFVSYKSEKASEELQAAKQAIELLGGKVFKQQELILPHSDIYRNFIVIQKQKATPKRYPRKAGLPSKEPL